MIELLIQVIGFAAVSVQLELLRREFQAYKIEQHKQHAEHRSRIASLEKAA